jgi:hypothetical protein
MPKEDSAKPNTNYQQANTRQSPREVWCGHLHSSIEDAIVHAERNLGMRGQPAEPYWGTMRFTDSYVNGWQVNAKKRYRLDFAKNFTEENRKAAVWSGTPHLKGTQGVHVNQENFDDPLNPGVSKVCHPTEASLQWADTYWNKWTRKYRQR